MDQDDDRYEQDASIAYTRIKLREFQRTFGALNWVRCKTLYYYLINLIILAHPFKPIPTTFLKCLWKHRNNNKQSGFLLRSRWANLRDSKEVNNNQYKIKFWKLQSMQHCSYMEKLSNFKKVS